MWETRTQNISNMEIGKATIRSTSKRRSAMKILLFLNRKNFPHTITEISEGTDLDWGTAKHNLSKLTECKFLTKVDDEMDNRTRYYQIANPKATTKAIHLYKRWVSYKLAKLVPTQKTYCKKIKVNPRFIEKCKFYGLTSCEGLNALQLCPKIQLQTINDHSGRNQDLFLWRKES